MSELSREMGQNGRRIRIAHLQLLPLLTGVQRVTLDELKGLDRAHFEPYLICQQPGPLSEAATQANIPCLFVPDLVREISPRHDWRALWQLRALCLTHAFDVIHTHSSKTGLLGRLAGRLAGVPLVIHTVHGYAFPAARTRRERRFYLGLEWLGARLCDAMIVLKEDDRKLAQQRLGVPTDRLILLPNGVDTERFRPRLTEERQRLRETLLNISADTLAIGMVGRLWRQKNPHCLVEAASRILRDARVDVRFFLIGDGELRESLEQRIAELGLGDRARILGWREDMPDLLPALDIFVLPSRWEGLSLAILEALACGLPVVVSDIPGNRDLVDIDRDGLVFPDDDAAALATALTRLINDAELRHAFGQAGREKVLRYYRLEQRIERIRDFYLQRFATADHREARECHLSNGIRGWLAHLANRR